MSDGRKNAEVMLLWTGGWDSTFRLLWLSWIECRTVQPLYIAEEGRASTAAELSAMKKILAELGSLRPDAASRIRQLAVHDTRTIPPVDRIRQSFDQILSRKFVGSQYRWLAEFCVQLGSAGLELSIHKDDKAHDLLQPLVTAHSGDSAEIALADRLRGTDEYEVFGRFRFPLFNLTKRDMRDLARKHGFESLMNLTWFCHSPISGERPCGRCSPCVYAMEEGMESRLPLGSRIRYHLRVAARIRHWLMDHPSIHHRLRKLRRAGGIL